MWVSNTFNAFEVVELPPVTWREVFRIEHRETQRGVFTSTVLEIDWHAFQLPMPYGPAEAPIGQFIECRSRDAIFAYLSILSIRHWFNVSELKELDQAAYHISVFSVPNNPEAAAFSQTQVAFVRDRVKWVRFISLLDL